MRKLVLPVLKWTGLVLLALLIGLALFLFWYRSASQPQIDGKLTLPGLGAPVEVIRDAEGIPHIFAKSTADAVFALGYVHAQDRLWQMEMQRRIAAGRIAEVVGPAALDTDRFMRTLGVRRNAEAIYANLPAATRAMVDSYARGVNAYLETRKGPLPPEFLILRAPAPAPWTAADSIGWQTMMAWDLSGNWSQELMRMRLAQRLPLERIREFMPPYPGENHLPTRDYTALYRELAGVTQQMTAVAAIAPPSLVEGMGSNNWVLGGSRTTSGKPLLANDPHLSLGAPALWYFAHLSTPEGNVIGATLPGMPGVILGRNDRIAWGFTNTAPDTQDLYIERIKDGDPHQYQTPDGWAAFKERTETIKVKGAADVSLTVRESRHGPVISGTLPVTGKLGLDAQKYAVAFAWTALRPDDLTLQAGMKMQTARNWGEFVEAVRDFHAPQQNMVYADVDGNIGYIAPARVPLRRADNDLKGLAPAPGWDARYDWTGFIPFEELPRKFNPANGAIATANEKIVPDDYPHFLTSEWTLPYRARRIGQMLDARAQHDLASMATMQADLVSLAAREMLPLLAGVKPRSSRAGEALALLGKWDGKMDAARAEPLIYAAWMREAAVLMFADELGPELFKDYREARNLHLAMVNVLADIDGQSRWCGNALQAGGAHACGDLLANALEAALADLDKRYGARMDKWRWGEAHEARGEHKPFGKVPLLARLFDVRVPTPGDTYTVNVGRYSARDEEAPYANRHAASLRALYDLNDLENSRFMHSTGQSGNVFSPAYRSFAKRWAAVDFVPMKTRRDSIEAGKLGTLVLAPEKR